MGHIYFCDVVHVDATIYRFAGSLDKVAHERRKGLALSITGIKVTLEETDKARPLSVIERLALVQELIAVAGRLGSERPTTRADASEFVAERCRAVRVVVPENAASGKRSPALSFWLSLPDATRGLLCLFEGTGGDAENPYNYARASTYTVLQSLVHFARRQQRLGILQGIIPNDEHPNPNARVDDTHPPSLVTQFHNVEPFAYDFVSDPLRVLETWGCDISTGLDVHLLYRVREYGPDATSNWQNVTVFGYALGIQSAG